MATLFKSYPILATCSKIHQFFLTDRGYNIQKLQSTANQIAKGEREEYLSYKSKKLDKVSNFPKNLITQWHPQLAKLQFILNKHKI